MIERYPARRRQRSWLVPAFVIAGVGAFFLWESGWRPVRFLDVPTGELADSDESDSASVLANGGAATASLDSDLGDSFDTLSEDMLQQFEPDLFSLDDDEQLENFSSRGMRPDNQPTGNPSGQPTSPGGVQQASFHESTHVGDVRDRHDQSTNFSADSFAPEPKANPPVDPEFTSKLARIDELLKTNDYLTAHRELSTLYWYEPQHRPLIRSRLEQTSGSIYAAPQPHYVAPYTVQHGDTLGAIAEKYQVPWKYLARLNRISGSQIREGSQLKVIKGPFGAVVDLSEFQLTIHAHGYYVRHYPVGIGRGQSSPVGEFVVQDKLENPTYYGPPGEGVIDADDPNNPLGERWIGLGNSYGIHGTCEPDSIGTASSRGCIRLRNEDAAEVFDLLSVGSTVMIRR